MMKSSFVECSDYYIDEFFSNKELMVKSGIQIVYDASLDAPDLIPAGGMFDSNLTGWERSIEDLERSAKRRGNPRLQMIHRLAQDHMMNITAPWGELMRVPSSRYTEWAEAFRSEL